MHTVVFGWFGASVVWFLALLWRVVKSALPGGVGLRGPGTIRLWLGFFCVLLSSATLEGALAGAMEAQENINRGGRALAAALAGIAHPPGAIAVAALVLAISLPWLIEFTWRSVLAWADDAFGFGLPQSWVTPRETSEREARPRELARAKSSGMRWRERRTREGSAAESPVRGIGGERFDAVGSRTLHDEPPLGVPSGQRNGRYQRPTVWRPASTPKRTAARAEASAASIAATAEAYSKRPAFERAGTPVSTFVEPVAPDGWLNSLSTSAAALGSTASAVKLTPGTSARGAAASAPAVRASASTSVSTSTGAGQRSPAAPVRAGVSASASTSAIAAARPVAASMSTSVPIVRGPLRKTPPSAATRDLQSPVFTPPAFSRAPSPAVPPPAPEAIQATLRSIEEKAALWTSLARASLARHHEAQVSSGNDGVSANPASAAGIDRASGNSAPLPADAWATAASSDAAAATLPRSLRRSTSLGAEAAADASHLGPVTNSYQAISPVSVKAVAGVETESQANGADAPVDAAEPTHSVSGLATPFSGRDLKAQAVTDIEAESDAEASQACVGVAQPASSSVRPATRSGTHEAITSAVPVEMQSEAQSAGVGEIEASEARVDELQPSNSASRQATRLDTDNAASPVEPQARDANLAHPSAADSSDARIIAMQPGSEPVAHATQVGMDDAAEAVARVEQAPKPTDSRAYGAYFPRVTEIEALETRINVPAVADLEAAMPAEPASLSARASASEEVDDFAAWTPNADVAATNVTIEGQVPIEHAPIANSQALLKATAAPETAKPLGTGSADMSDIGKPQSSVGRRPVAGSHAPAIGEARMTDPDRPTPSQKATTSANRETPSIPDANTRPSHTAPVTTEINAPWRLDAPAAPQTPPSLDAFATPSAPQAEADAPLDRADYPFDAAPVLPPPLPRALAEPIQSAPSSVSADTPPWLDDVPRTTPPRAQVDEQRPPLRGFTPTEFEFHAPQASAVELPTLDLLELASDDVEPVTEERLADTSQLIEQRLQEFKVPVTVVGASAGPVITRFEVEPALGVRGSQIVGLMKDLSRGLGLTSIRVVETIPGKTCMGLELPNAKRQMIRLSEILEDDVYRASKSNLTIAMGKDIVGNPVVTDLAKAPHMLVAGTTGSGKSVAINAMILSLLYKAKPEDVRLIMIDPKMLELSVYEGIPHLLAPVVTDMKLASNALNWCVGEMEKRYRLMSAVGVRNLQGFNQKIRNTEAAGKKLTNPFSLTPDAPEPLSTLPLIVVVIDELADLMMVAGKQIEQLIARLAQKARAAGIHLILATQRPSVDVITGLIKANIPTRVAFQVSSKIDSRTILDQMGAESLLGAGDMLFLPPGTGYPQRVHGAFVADDEVHRVVEYLKQFGEPEYEEGILSGPTAEGGSPDLFGETPDAEADPLYDEAVAFVVRTRRASISSVQRQLRIGYNRAARLVEQMESAGLVSPMGTNGNREVLAPPGPAD